MHSISTEVEEEVKGEFIASLVTKPQEAGSSVSSSFTAVI
jgi:hypothetical protein